MILSSTTADQVTLRHRIRKIHEPDHLDRMQVAVASLSACVGSCNGYQDFVDLNYRSYNVNGVEIY